MALDMRVQFPSVLPILKREKRLRKVTGRLMERDIQQYFTEVLGYDVESVTITEETIIIKIEENTINIALPVSLEEFLKLSKAEVLLFTMSAFIIVIK